MSQSQPFPVGQSDVAELEQRLQQDWPNLRLARQKTEQQVTKLRELLQELDIDDPDLAVVAFGSLGRQEYMEGASDLDWALLIDGQANSDHFDQAQAISAKISEHWKEPGPGGTFGKLVVSHDLLHLIGGDHDTNVNTTRRTLLLLEAMPLGLDPAAYHRVTRGILSRYLQEDRTLRNPDQRPLVPRFLLNDFARYWRTMAVDFAYKRREREGRGMGLRNIKLRMSRKLLFASALITCFAFELGLLDRPDAQDESNAVTSLQDFCSKTPLDILAKAFLAIRDKLKGDTDAQAKVSCVATRAFASYDYFLAKASEHRDHLDSLKSDDMEDDKVFQDLRQDAAHRFRDALLELFFDLDSDLKRLTRLYGVF